MPKKRKIDEKPVVDTTVVETSISTHIGEALSTAEILFPQETDKQKLQRIFGRMPAQQFVGDFTLWLNELRTAINNMSDE